MATGLLVILLGRGTKLSEHVMASDKTYEGVMHLGVSTNTEDVDGEVVSEADYGGLTQAQVEEQLRRRVGDQMQVPPMVSAVKKQGVPLYKLARKGQVVEREARLIHVYEFSLLHFQLPRVEFRLRCTKGTYVRTLCADIGRDLGCGAFLEALRRTRAGAFRVEETLPMEEILKMDRAQLAAKVRPIHEARAEESVR